MKLAAWIVLYLVLGAAVFAGAAWWLRPAAVAAREAAKPAFEYPTVTAPPGADAADWKAGHIDGWKWCVRHIGDGQVARDDGMLRGFCPPDPQRTAAFLAGYHAARSAYDALVADGGEEDARAAVLRAKRAKPQLHDLRVVALPP